jgi:two-component system response regulator YesN
LQRLTDESRDTIYLCGSENSLNALVLGDNDRDIEERAYSFARSALDELDRAGYGDVRVSIGETVNRLCDVTRSMKSARHTRHIMEYSRVPARVKRIVGVRDIAEEPPRPVPNLDIQPLYDRMKYVKLSDVKEQFKDYVNALQAADAYISIAASYLRAEVLMTAFRIIKEADGDPQKALDREWLEDDWTVNGADIGAYVPVALMILKRAVEYRDAHGRMKGNPVVNKARQYLDRAFADPSLTFQDVVDHVSMSSSHFSTVFSQEMGVTFTEYLTFLRLGKAKELLAETSMRSSEIAYSVGYNDPHYFSYLFKKNVGMTPSEFRTQSGGEQMVKSSK